MPNIGRILSRSLLTASVMMCMAPANALEELADDQLAAKTGEGIAILLEDTRFVMQDVDQATFDSSTLANRELDTGYIRVIPVGPLSDRAVADGAGKADVFLYGLGLSKADGNLNSRFNSGVAGGITWGSISNPWLLKVESSDTPDFSGNVESLSYLVIESPLKHDTVPTAKEDGSDAYNLKLGVWGDIFIRDPNVAEDMTQTGNQFSMNGADRANRMRVQAIWDGLGLNGSSIKLFQTLGGASNVNGMSTAYNYTLGLAGLLRLNSQEVTSSTDVTNRALRLSSSEVSTSTQSKLSTPAINGGVAPTFANDSGLYLYSPNVNLVLGSTYQPLTIGTAADAKNLVVEIARIPNVPAIYEKIYTDYSNNNVNASSRYQGSTCNVGYCGFNGTQGYQGNNATHSSIAIGDVTRDPVTNELQASRLASAQGIEFNIPGTNGTQTSNLGSAAVDGFLINHLKITTNGL